MNEHVDGMNSAHAAPYDVQNKGVIDWTESEGEQAARMAKVHETYGEQIARVPAHTHEENARNFFDREPDQTVSRCQRIRGANPEFVHFDDAAFLHKEPVKKARGMDPNFTVYEDMTYLSENPADKIEKILQKLEDEGLDEPTNEQLADHFNQKLIAQGRNPVFSAQMLAAQNAAALRKQQQNRKKKRK